MNGSDAALGLALDSAAAAGLVVSVSAGNDGGFPSIWPSRGIGLYGVSAPSNAPGVISVASTQDNLIAKPVLTISPGGLQVIPSPRGKYYTCNFNFRLRKLVWRVPPRVLVSTYLYNSAHVLSQAPQSPSKQIGI